MDQAAIAFASENMEASILANEEYAAAIYYIEKILLDGSLVKGYSYTQYDSGDSTTCWPE